ncbi:MAG TPA: hypothetical protein DCE42_02305 [Myxococcales bacterium]|nr:hypothetical protein [Myxococcales bacterium]
MFKPISHQFVKHLLKPIPINTPKPPYSKAYLPKKSFTTTHKTLPQPTNSQVLFPPPRTNLHKANADTPQPAKQHTTATPKASNAGFGGRCPPSGCGWQTHDTKRSAAATRPSEARQRQGQAKRGSYKAKQSAAATKASKARQPYAVRASGNLPSSR